jgi:hypothetical protein
VRSVSAELSPRCEHCGGDGLRRLFSRVAVLRGEDGMGFDEGSLSGVDENDPRSMARWVRKMSKEMGEPLDAEMEGQLEEMEAGRMPDDLGDDFGGGEFDDVD